MLRRRNERKGAGGGVKKGEGGCQLCVWDPESILRTTRHISSLIHQKFKLLETANLVLF